MKKILLFLVALVATLSMNAQTTEIYKGTTKEATYSSADVRVEFGTSGSDGTIKVYQGETLKGTYTGSEYKVISKELPPSTGTAKRTGDIDVNWVQLWKDGPKFAEYNVGATNNKATDFGYYLAWGGSSNKDATYNAGSADLSGSDDSAYNLWGEHWRMPTLAEIDSLMSTDKCSTTWYDGRTKRYNNTNAPGYLITGKGDYSSNSIFLPAAGNYVPNMVRDSKSGRYWSSAPNGSDANQLYISNGTFMSCKCERLYGCSVRPIYVEEVVAVTGVSLNKTELKVGKGDTETLSATVTPADATNKKVLWTSSNEQVATVDAYGKVKGVKVGKCDITATTEDGGKTATCAVEVAVLTTGTAKATIGGQEVDVNWVQFWENGPKFAEYNVGVTDGKAESYGGYYAWGGSQDKVDDHNTTNTGSGNLTGTDDTATKLWGSNWRMPTKDELQALINNCDVQWTDSYNDTGMGGRIYTGKGDYASNSIFLPAAGYYSDGSVSSLGSDGRFWSSAPDGNDCACYLFFGSGRQNVSDSRLRKYGFSVRAVLAK